MANVKTNTVSSVDKLKTLMAAKNSILKEWDVSFGINGEMLINVLSFISGINPEIPMKFYEDKIFMHQKSSDSIQYAELEISSGDILDYKVGLTGDPHRKDAKSVMKDINGMDFKGILIDTKGTIEEIQSFSQKDDIVTVRVDTTYYKRIEFHCPGNVVIWAQLLEPTALIKSLEKLPDIIRKVRNNPDIKKASVIIEPATFNRICNIGGSVKKRDIDQRVFIELDKQDGLFISSGDRLKGRIFALKPVDIVDQLGGYSGEVGGEFDSVNMTEGEYGNDTIMGMEEVGSSDVGGADVGSVDIGGDIGSTDIVGEMTDSTVPDDVPDFAPSSFVVEEKETKAKKPDRKGPENRAQVDQVLGMEVDSSQYIYMQQEFLGAFSKLKGLSPISIEVRTDKPIILEQRPYNGVKALLTIAPRIENEEDK